MPNRLNLATSPYLRQHKDNPVDWYPWGKDAFAAAQAEGRPILLSIGYSACHWCHVMAHESFEDKETAQLMNRLFVNIKVDREEHPDVDQIYQHALQLFSEHGGWPLTMFLLPSGEPFFGGTYFPPDDRYGRPSFRRVLTALSDAYREKQDDVREQAERVVASLGQLEARGAELPPGDGDPPPRGPLLPDYSVRAAAKLSARMDERYGGFSGAPKFPSASSLELQLRGAARSRCPEDAGPALLTLSRMAEGGIYDHLGGGFARYSTDEAWLVPHFEKMLYDNGQLLRLYAAGLQLQRGLGALSEAARYEHVLRQTRGWLEREMRDPSGGLYAAQDADSEGVEGKYFVFRPEEVAEICGPAGAEILCRCYDVRPGGNWNDPHGHGPKNASILHLVDRPRDEAEAQLLDQAMARLLLARQRRVPPGTDDKILTGWNGLLLSGLCEAGRVLGDGEFIASARRTADFLLRELRGPQGALFRTFKGGQARLPGTLDDHAFLAEGLLLLAGVSGELSYLDAARALMDAALLNFYDEARGAFYLAEEDAGGAPLPVRPTSLYDSAIPSGLSVACKNLLRLGELLGEDGRSYTQLAAKALSCRAEVALRNVFGLSSLCAAVDLLQHGLSVTVIVYPAGAEPAARALRAAADAVYVPDPFTLVVPAGGAIDLPGGLRALADGKEPRAGQATAYVCHGQRCSAPVTDPAELMAILTAP